jgi:hypothetical protein
LVGRGGALRGGVLIVTSAAGKCAAHAPRRSSAPLFLPSCVLRYMIRESAPKPAFGHPPRALAAKAGRLNTRFQESLSAGFKRPCPLVPIIQHVPRALTRRTDAQNVGFPRHFFQPFSTFHMRRPIYKRRIGAIGSDRRVMSSCTCLFVK